MVLLTLHFFIFVGRPAKGVKLYIKAPDNVRGQYRSLITSLNKRIAVIEVPSLETCDIALVFCPVVSRLGTDVEAAFKDVPGNILLF